MTGICNSVRTTPIKTRRSLLTNNNKCQLTNHLTEGVHYSTYLFRLRETFKTL